VVQAPGREVPVLRGVSFAVPAGATLGVIGPSAAGKSSLARTLVGVWQPAGGAVRLDGSELAHWEPDQLGRSLGYRAAGRGACFPAASPRISAASAPATTGASWRPRRLAGVRPKSIRAPAAGLQRTEIGEGGAALSGGQRQRVALARAIYGKPALIVLDEPNASLDAAGEQALMAAVQALKAAGSTVILVTHKTNSLSLCDLILLLNEGAVAGFGPRDEVLAKVLGPRLVRPAGPQIQVKAQTAEA